MVIELEYFPEFGEPSWHRKDRDEETVGERDSRPPEEQYTAPERQIYRRAGLSDD